MSLGGNRKSDPILNGKIMSTTLDKYLADKIDKLVESRGTYRAEVLRAIVKHYFTYHADEALAEPYRVRKAAKRRENGQFRKN